MRFPDIRNVFCMRHKTAAQARAVAANLKICKCLQYTDDVRVVPSFDRADIPPVCEWLIAQCLRLPRIVFLHTYMTPDLCWKLHACMQGNKICVIF